MMRILFAYRYGNVGGVCTQLANRLTGFRRDPEIEVHFAFLKDHGLVTALANHPHLLIDSSSKKIAAYCKAKHINVVLIIDTPEILHALRRWPSKSVLLLEVHTTYIHRLEYLRSIPGRVDGVVVPSGYSQGLVRHRLSVPRPVHVIRNCIDTEMFKPTPHGAYLSTSSNPVCVWVGKLDDHKNWRDFLNLAEGLASQHAALEFWLVGGSSASDGTKSVLLDGIYRRGLGGRLRWLDRIPRQQMAHVFRSAAARGGVCVVTSRNESFGMSVAESILCGCPVVATAVGALGELTADTPAENALKTFALGDLQKASELILTAIDAGPVSDAEKQMWHRELAETVAPTIASAAIKKIACALMSGHLKEDNQ